MSFNFEREALIASGIRDESRRAEYLKKLDDLHNRIASLLGPSPEPVTRARRLFEWLWVQKPKRYKKGGPYRLSDVVDAQIRRESGAVGNCLGLTLLYHCLLKKMAVYAGALYLDSAFGGGPHVLTLLRANEGTIDIENILPDGFDYRGHLTDRSRKIWGERELVADIHCSRGNDSFKAGVIAAALKGYEMALEISPNFEKAALNKAIVLEKIHAEEG